jgi:uncharacterized protein Yka (UPF0111/DUF47 family)
MRQMILSLIQAKTEETEKNIIEVERLEHDVDVLYTSTKLGFSKYDQTVPTSAFLNLYDLLKEIEDAADSCEYTADQARMILMRGQ